MNTHTTNIIIRSLGVAMLGLGACLHPVQALEVSQSVSVTASDLDLTSAAGTATLKRRIANAVRDVCGTVDTSDHAAMAELHDCQVTATADATAQMQQRVAAARRIAVLASSIPR